MMTTGLHRNSNVWCRGVRLSFLVVTLLVTLSGCGIFLPFPEQLVPADETRENVTLAEAQSLVPFVICLPTYVPDEVEPNPQIIYHADFGDPMESDIRLRYYDSDNQTLKVEIYQRHRPGASTSRELDEGVRSFYERDLLAWEVGWSRADEIREQVTINVTGYQEGNIKYWLFEVVEPTSLQANMIEWGNDPVAYQVYTHLSVEEARKVALSMTDCMVQPTATPTSD